MDITFDNLLDDIIYTIFKIVNYVSMINMSRTSRHLCKIYHDRVVINLAYEYQVEVRQIPLLLHMKSFNENKKIYLDHVYRGCDYSYTNRILYIKQRFYNYNRSDIMTTGPNEVLDTYDNLYKLRYHYQPDIMSVGPDVFLDKFGNLHKLSFDNKTKIIAQNIVCVTKNLILTHAGEVFDYNIDLHNPLYKNVKYIYGYESHNSLYNFLIYKDCIIIKNINKNKGFVTTKEINLCDIVQISVSCKHTLALNDKGYVFGWGKNDNAQIGFPNIKTIKHPTIIPGLETIKQISAAEDHSLALTHDGKVYAMGNNKKCCLGIKDMKSVCKPTIVPNLINIVEIAAEYNYSLAVDDKDNVYVWGHNKNDQLQLGNKKETINTPILYPLYI